MANISAIKLPNGTTYDLKDNGALQLTGGQVTGPVTFGDAISVDEATIGDLVVNGNASFTNNIQANTINGIAVGSSPSFTDTKVTQTESNNDEAYEILFSETAGSTTKTEETKKNSCLKYNPSSHALILSGQLTAYSIFSTGTSSNNGSSIKQITASENSNYIELKTYNASSNTTSIYVTPTKLSIRGNSDTEYISVTNAGVVKITGLSTPTNDTDAVTKAYVDDNIPTVPSNIVNTITTTAGTHTAITSQKGNVSFKVPTTAAHVGIKFGYTTSGNNRAVLQDGSGNLYVTQKDDDSDTKNTAGSTDSSSKLFLIGATSQAANPQTYSHDTAYVGTDGYLYSGSQKTLVEYYGDGSSTTRIQITPTIDVSNNYARFTIGASDGTNMMQLSIEGNNVNIFDVAHEKTYFAVYGATSLYDDKVHITNVHTPTYDSDAANKKYVDDKCTKTTATLTTTWSSNQQTVTVSGVTTSNTVVVTPAPASYEAYCEAGIYCSAQAANSLTFKCSTVPTSSLTVNIMILK